MDVDDAFREEHLAHELPTSMVPRLHAICFRTVAPGASSACPAGHSKGPLTHLAAQQAEAAAAKAGQAVDLNLLAYPKSDTQAYVLAGLAKAPSSSNASGFLREVAQAQQQTQILKRIRSQVLGLLTSALGGDKLAAEYLLLNLISRGIRPR